MSFRFRLERVLRYRQRQVDERTRLVATARRDVDSATTVVATARQAVSDHTAAATAERTSALDTTRLQIAATWRGQLESRLVGAIEDHSRARDHLVQCERELEAAWRDREILQRLKDRQAENWRDEQARRERRQLDEVGSIRAALAGYGRRERSRNAAVDAVVASEKRTP